MHAHNMHIHNVHTCTQTHACMLAHTHVHACCMHAQIHMESHTHADGLSPQNSIDNVIHVQVVTGGGGGGGGTGALICYEVY